MFSLATRLWEEVLNAMEMYVHRIMARREKVDRVRYLKVFEPAD